MSKGYQIHLAHLTKDEFAAAMQVMGLELSMASYNPNFMPTIWHDLPPMGSTVQCTGSLNQANKGIREATPTAITVEMDVSESSQVGDMGGEIVRYEYFTRAMNPVNNQYITRETTRCGSPRDARAALPFLGAGQGTGKPRNVRVINDDLNIVNGQQAPAVFRYYNAIGPGVELFPDTNPAAIPNIRRIDITLAVETDEVDPASKTRKRMIYSTSVLVRNHAF
jgi:hypothetical protein